MREKTLQLFLTFAATAGAMAMEKACAETNQPGRLIPVPGEISASCGLGWKAPLAAEQALEALMEEQNIPCQGRYYMMLR